MIPWIKFSNLGIGSTYQYVAMQYFSPATAVNNPGVTICTAKTAVGRPDLQPLQLVRLRHQEPSVGRIGRSWDEYERARAAIGRRRGRGRRIVAAGPDQRDVAQPRRFDHGRPGDVDAAVPVTGGVAAYKAAYLARRLIERGAVVRTVDRRGLFRAETPQIFRRGILERAVELSRREGFQGTDEATLVERLPGARIAAVNALSDVWAMGGTPLLAIAVLGWPTDKLDASVAGAVSACAGASGSTSASASGSRDRCLTDRSRAARGASLAPAARPARWPAPRRRRRPGRRRSPRPSPGSRPRSRPGSPAPARPDRRARTARRAAHRGTRRVFSKAREY